MGERIDMTPTWTGVVPVMVALIESGNAEGRATAISELYRIAGLLDGMVSALKGETMPAAPQTGEVL